MIKFSYELHENIKLIISRILIKNINEFDRFNKKAFWNNSSLHCWATSQFFIDELNFSLEDITDDTIYTKMFYSSYVSTLKIPNTINTIEEYAFYGCRYLEKIYIPESVINIKYEDYPSDIFYGCDPTKLVIYVKRGSYMEYALIHDDELNFNYDYY